MAKSARTHGPGGRRGPSVPPVRVVEGEVPVVGGREPCPCGSGRRYKGCHGKPAAHAAQTLVRRPFEGLASEGDWVALREIVPAATAVLTMAGAYEGRTATLATVLPMAAPAMVRLDGAVYVGLQVAGGSGDVSRDVAAALLTALESDAGTIVPAGTLPAAGPRLQDLLDVSAPLHVQVHDGFDFWLEGVEIDARDADVAASLERANAGVIPTVRLVSVEAAYWAGMPGRSTLRWVLPDDEEPCLDALARLHGASGGVGGVGGGLSLGEGTRFIGTFRAHGLLVPVWDLPIEMRADDCEDVAVGFRSRLDEALASTDPLTSAQRQARSGLLTRQVTLR